MKCGYHLLLLLSVFLRISFAYPTKLVCGQVGCSKKIQVLLPDFDSWQVFAAHISTEPNNEHHGTAIHVCKYTVIISCMWSENFQRFDVRIFVQYLHVGLETLPLLTGAFSLMLQGIPSGNNYVIEMTGVSATFSIPLGTESGKQLSLMCYRTNQVFTISDVKGSAVRGPWTQTAS